MQLNKECVIIPCSKVKLSRSAPAGEMYRGKSFLQLFGRIDRTRVDVLIISAKYGLVLPDRVIEPYDVSVTKKSRGRINLSEEGMRIQRETVKANMLACSKVVATQAPMLVAYDRVICFVGENYRKILNRAFASLPLIKDKLVFVDTFTEFIGIRPEVFETEYFTQVPSPQLELELQWE